MQFKKAEPFNPELAAIMRTAFYAAWQSLVDSGSLLTRSERTRGDLAHHIIDAAQAGETDANKLRDDALAFLANASERDNP